MELLGKIALVAFGAGLIYLGTRLVALAFRLWRLGMAARGILAAILGAVYTFSPVDAVPDVIVGIGWVDDLIVMGLTAMYIWKLFSQRQASRRPPGGSVRSPRPTVIPQLPAK
jgi:hypothetical protein